MKETLRPVFAGLPRANKFQTTLHREVSQE